MTTIQKAANTGEQGDGIISSYEIDTLVKIKDGETNEKAL